jgi:hypothetical protein
MSNLSLDNFSIPAEFTVARQGAEVVRARCCSLSYMDDHPEKRQENAGSIVIVSLMAAFPCDGGK